MRLSYNVGLWYLDNKAFSLQSETILLRPGEHNVCGCVWRHILVRLKEKKKKKSTFNHYFHTYCLLSRQKFVCTNRPKYLAHHKKQWTDSWDNVQTQMWWDCRRIWKTIMNVSILPRKLQISISSFNDISSSWRRLIQTSNHTVTYCGHRWHSQCPVMIL